MSLNNIDKLRGNYIQKWIFMQCVRKEEIVPETSAKWFVHFYVLCTHLTVHIFSVFGVSHRPLSPCDYFMLKFWWFAIVIYSVISTSVQQRNIVMQVKWAVFWRERKWRTLSAYFESESVLVLWFEPNQFTKFTYNKRNNNFLGEICKVCSPPFVPFVCLESTRSF